MLEARNLSKSYRGIPALQGVNFAVGQGKILGYVGPNGSGKSTTVKIVTGLLEPDAGQVLFRGQNIRHCLEPYRAAFGYVPEEAHVYTHLSGLEYLQLVGRLRGLPEMLLERRASHMLGLFGLASSRHAPIALYSKGMKQRVLLSAALLHNPDLLIFDEPLSGLDVVSARLFKDLLQSLASAGKAILYISHVLEVVEQVCDDVIILQRGLVRASGSPAALRTSANTSSLESAFSAVVEHEDTRRVAEDLVAAMEADYV